MSTQEPSTLEPLADDYEIVGELSARDDAQAFIGRRREDDTDVLVIVARAPAGDERNALTLFAADAHLLANLTHRNLVRIVEGRWLGADAFAVVEERVAAPTLEELLERGEEVSCPRIASILQDVNGVLEWAREQKVVHRCVVPATVFVEPDTDRVLVSFVIRPLGITGPPDADGDARTIAALAWAMLARSPDPAAQLDETLAERRPDLPKRLVEETEALHRAARGGAAMPDIRRYIALIATADALKLGEEEMARAETVIAEEQHIVLKELAKERTELANERDELVEEREELAEERLALAREREELAREREAQPSTIVRWAVSGAVLLLVAIIVAAAFGIGRARRPSAAQATVHPASSVIDSSGGRIVPALRAPTGTPRVAPAAPAGPVASPPTVARPTTTPGTVVRRDSVAKETPDTLARPESPS